MATIKQKWHERFFGKQLLKCDSVRGGVNETVSSGEALHVAETTGIYFSFANINVQSDEFTKHLVELYERLNGTAHDAGKKLEVVQVVLWANNDVFHDFEDSHRNSILDLPWFAVPFREIELKTKLSRRFQIKSGVPTLVLVDRDGATISCSAQERLLEDPLGTAFPWRPRPVDQVLKDVALQRGRLYGTEHPVIPKEDITYGDLPDCVRGFYFSAHWCPPCRAFTPQLAEVYRLLRKREPGFELIFVSSDRSADSFSTYLETMPWLAIPWQQAAVRAELAQLYGVRGIPTLLLLDSNGHVITTDARTELAEDPLAQNFPWKPRPVNILTERFATKLHDYPAIVLFVEVEDTELQFAESVLTPAANAYYNKHNINFNAPSEEMLFGGCGGGGGGCAADELRCLQFLVGPDTETSDILRDLVGLDDVVPLLVAVDIPNRRYAVMPYGTEINADSVQRFVEHWENGDLELRRIDERLPDSNNALDEGEDLDEEEEDE